MKDPYPIEPFPGKVAAKISVPGSKSISNRVLVMAALAKGETVIENCLSSRDTELMMQALRTLGFEVSADCGGRRVRVRGEGGRIPVKRCALDIGNSGTSARFLTAFLCLGDGGVYELDGDEAMRRRPIQKLVDSLNRVGADIETTEGFFPIRVRANGLKGGRVEVDASASSQFVSALLMVAPYAKSDMMIVLKDASLRRGYIDLTLRMMNDFGIPRTHIEQTENFYTIRATSEYQANETGYWVEADASAASYFMALPLVLGGEVEIAGIAKNSMQGDLEFAQVLERCGAEIHYGDQSLLCRCGRSTEVPRAGSEDFYRFSDTFLTFAAISPLLAGETKISGIGHTRLQECDRVAAAAEGLSRVGQTVIEQTESLQVEPASLRRATIRTFEDHRVAMSFAILGCYDLRGDGTPWLEIENPLCCRKTFPKFFETLESARQQSAQK